MKQQDIGIICTDSGKTTRVQEQLVKFHVADVIQIFKALSDETRMKIAYTLTLEEELCVNDVANMVGATNATASHHLRHLKALGLAKDRKEGKMVYYSLDDDHVKQLIDMAYIHQKEVSERNRM